MKTKLSIITLKHKQRGATLFTSLVFLTLMTIVSVSAAKIASLDTVIAGNNQQQMLVFQQTDKTLTGFSNPVVVVLAVNENHGPHKPWKKTMPVTKYEKREVNNRNVKYTCKGGDEGLAVGVGSDTAGRCYVFDLFAEDKLVSYGLLDKHYRGVGKVLPNTDSYD